jgi:CelD/BcsL family acetyltransferase involved in cellulose biosynthesis
MVRHPIAFSKYRVETVDNYADFKALRKDWNCLARNQSDIYPFICFEWFDLWFRSFLKNAQLHIYVLKNNQKICAILPLIKCEGLIGRVIKLGVNDDSCKIDMISDGLDYCGYIETCVCELMKENWLMVYLEDLLKRGESSQFISSCLGRNQHSFIGDKRCVRESVVINTAMGWENLRSNLPKKFIKNIKHQRNRLTKSGDVKIVRFSGAEELSIGLDCIEEISSNSWQGEKGTGIFSEKEKRMFYAGLADFASRQDWLSIWVLFFDNIPIAYEYHLTIESVDYALKAEYNRKYAELSPGAVLDAHVVEQLAHGSTKKYDLLGFKEPYKMRWSLQTEKYIRIYVFKRNIIGTIWHFVDFTLRSRLKRVYPLRLAIQRYRSLAKKML